MQEAESRYEAGLAGIGRLRPGARRGIRGAARMYREIMNEVRARSYDNITRRAVVPTGRKLLVLAGADYTRRRDRLRSAASRTDPPFGA